MSLAAISRLAGRARAPLSIAPMMEHTDRHFRFFFRQVSRRALLYTEMVTAQAVLRGDRAHLLGFDPQEHPISLQLGGEDPRLLAECARIAAEWGYDEVNLNVGCPSDRVKKGRFGACLMAEPERVAAVVAAMRDAVDLPVTVKHRIGIDDADSYDDLRRFIDVVAAAGCDRFTVHARKAWLSGLSPKQNREIPPLRHEDVHRLKRERPDLVIEINGGIRNLAEALRHLALVDAVMIGRAAYETPWAFAAVDRVIYGDERPPATRSEVVAALLPYVETFCRQGGHLGHVTRHLLGLFNAEPGARAWRRHISERSHRPGAGPEVLEQALALVPPEVAAEPGWNES